MSNGNGGAARLPVGFGAGVPILTVKKVFRCKVGHEYSRPEGVRVRVQVGVMGGGRFTEVGIVNTSGYICPQCIMDFFSVNFKVEEEKVE